MNLSETARLMAVVQAFNNRTVGEADVMAWQSVLDDVPLADAEEAVRRHYRGSSEWIMPAHVRRAVEQIELERARAARKWAPGQAGVAPEQELPQLTSGEVAAMPEKLREWLERLVASRGVDNPREALKPRTVAWEREQRAYLRAHDGAPNPLYRLGPLTDSGTSCGALSPHPAHEWSIGPNEGEAEPDKFWCQGEPPTAAGRVEEDDGKPSPLVTAHEVREGMPCPVCDKIIKGPWTITHEVGKTTCEHESGEGKPPYVPLSGICGKCGIESQDLERHRLIHPNGSCA